MYVCMYVCVYVCTSLTDFWFGPPKRTSAASMGPKASKNKYPFFGLEIMPLWYRPPPLRACTAKRVKALHGWIWGQACANTFDGMTVAGRHCRAGSSVPRVLKIPASECILSPSHFFILHKIVIVMLARCVIHPTLDGWSIVSRHVCAIHVEHQRHDWSGIDPKHDELWAVAWSPKGLLGIYKKMLEAIVIAGSFEAGDTTWCLRKICIYTHTWGCIGTLGIWESGYITWNHSKHLKCRGIPGGSTGIPFSSKAGDTAWTHGNMRADCYGDLYWNN